MRIFKIHNNTLTEIKDGDFSLFGDESSLCISSPAELELIKDIGRVSKYALKECQSNNHHLRIDHHKGYTYGILSFLEIKKNRSSSITLWRWQKPKQSL